MPMAAEDIIRLIKEGIPDAEVEIQDLAGDGDHYAATVDFAGLRRQIQGAAAPDGLWRAGRPHGRRAACAEIDHHGAKALGALYSGPDPRSPWALQEIDMSEPQVFDRIRDEIGKNDVLLFMKGTPVFPQCGFSAAVVEVLSELGVKFHGVNILVDPELRQGIKEFSQWPTIPQLYVKGEFVGGCDIVREMFETGELEQLMKEKGVTLANAA